MPSSNTAPASASIPVLSSAHPGSENIFASTTKPPTVTARISHASSGSVDVKKPSTPFDQLDDFEGLEDAKEGSADDEFANISRFGLEDAKEGSADDEFANISRFALDDFNPVFDSSPPPSQAKSENTAFGVESSFDFANISDGSSQQHGGVALHPQLTQGMTTRTGVAVTTSGNVASKTPLNPDNQDWEALFAGLDAPASEGTKPAKTSGERGAPVIAAAGGFAVAAEKPTTSGRGLTQEGVHDAPDLKHLVDMGYERKEALEALEKCNYDAERVSETSPRVASNAAVARTNAAGSGAQDGNTTKLQTMDSASRGGPSIGTSDGWWR